jgi:uncharacterized protein (TIGR02996 family)
MRTFEFNDAKSHKFWSIDVKGKTFTVTFGKIGTAGQSQTKTFKDDATAQTEADKLIREKTKKGYVEKTQKPVAAEDAAFRKSLTANPDDLAGWCAYADYLVEQGDPRGEFMQTQIALEDESRPKKDRTALKKKESALLREHEKEWLGGLAAIAFAERDPDDYHYGRFEPVWRRGVLSHIIVQNLDMKLAQALATDPVTTFVRELHIHDQNNGYYDGREAEQPQPRAKTPRGEDRHTELFELIGSPLLTNLRHFQMGHEIPPEDGWCDCHTHASGLEHVVASMDRVEVLDLYCKGYDTAALFRLRNLTHLRELRVYHQYGQTRRSGAGYEYPLDVLAKNTALANLTHLLIHTHQPEDIDDRYRGISYLPLEQVQALLRSKHLKKLTHLQLRLSAMGDDGIREFIASGILKQLKWLDLQHGCVTDEGARLLAACEDAKRLERIDLSRNAVSKKGLSALRKAGVNAVANSPLTEQEVEERHYLREGDFE